MAFPSSRPFVSHAPENPFAQTVGPLSHISSPTKTTIRLAERVRSEVETTVKDGSVSSAWAELEAAVLESELSEE